MSVPLTTPLDAGSFPLITMGSGPGTIDPATLQAMAHPLCHHEDPEFLGIMREVSTKLQRVLLTHHDVLVLEGEAVLGLEAVVANCVAAGDHCLNLVSGHYGKAFGTVLAGRGADVTEVTAAYNDAVDLAAVEVALDRDPDIKFLSVVHSETPSCTVNPVADICKLAHDRGIITIVDSVSGAGGTELRVDDWGIDFCVVGPQKCLGAAPGLAIVSISEQGWGAVRPENLPATSYLSLLPWRDLWLESGILPYTPAVSLVFALSEALDLLIAEGIEHAWRRHAVCADAVRHGVQAMGLSLWAKTESIAANSCTGVGVPAGVDAAELRALMRDKYGVYVSSGVEELTNRIIRIGHMAATAQPGYVLAALGALAAALEDAGGTPDVPSGMAAAIESLRAL